MKPKELRRDIKMQYSEWRSTQHAAIENISGEENNKVRNIDMVKRLYNMELAQLLLIRNSIGFLEEHIKKQLEELK